MTDRIRSDAVCVTMMQSNACLRTDAFIDGAWTPAASGARFAVFDPATGEKIADVADCGADDARRAIAAAERALPDWARRPAQERAAILRRWRDLMLANIDALAAILTAEMGKPRAEAAGEIRYGAAYLEWFAEEARRAYGDVIPSESKRTRTIVLKQPIGVCAAITPWNFPNAMLMRKAGAALAAGCTMVAKPAEDTPLSALAAAALAEEAGLPAGVLNVAPAARPEEVGRELTTNPAVRKVSFTGSTETGRILLTQMASTVKKASMELGGDAPLIVFDDADLDAALAGAVASKFRNAGQTCICANRLFVQRGVYEAFAERFVHAAQALRVGRGDQEGVDIGPLVNEAALAKVERLLTKACAQGARILAGGRRHAAGPLFFEPTVLGDVRPDMEIAQVEIFGPIAPLIVFDNEQEVVRLANATAYGLAAYAYTADLARAFRVGEALDYGMVGINETAISAVSAPFGGVKQSGMGREGSKYGLADYLETKYLCLGGIEP
ncbi:MAG: NADP-dependent succinate-semialdehyde dehydrogenase [Amphiplicatus sp.]